MATPSIQLIQALRETSKKLKNGVAYQWGHMGSCNCGLLAQHLTAFSKDEIHAFAMQRHGDWSEQLHHYCENSGLEIDQLIAELLKHGLSLKDLEQLEKLSNPEVLNRIVPYYGYPARNSREDLILYLDTWSEILEEELLENINIEDLRRRTSDYQDDLYELTCLT